jgi:hypothetical protein
MGVKRRARRRLGNPCWRGYIEAEISPVCFGFVFSTSFIISNMARFVFSFVFSTGTCFQQLLRFVFRFVFGYLCSLSLYLNNFSGLFFKKGILFCFFTLQISRLKL